MAFRRRPAREVPRAFMPPASETHYESGPAGFLVTPYLSSRLMDLIAVFSEEAKTIPPLTPQRTIIW
jgi:hypothetical protein